MWVGLTINTKFRALAVRKGYLTHRRLSWKSEDSKSSSWHPTQYFHPLFVFSIWFWRQNPTLHTHRDAPGIWASSAHWICSKCEIFGVRPIWSQAYYLLTSLIWASVSSSSKEGLWENCIHFQPWALSPVPSPKVFLHFCRSEFIWRGPQATGIIWGSRICECPSGDSHGSCPIVNLLFLPIASVSIWSVCFLEPSEEIPCSLPVSLLRAQFFFGLTVHGWWKKNPGEPIFAFL